MSTLPFCSRVARARWLNWRGKILAMAFVGGPYPAPCAGRLGGASRRRPLGGGRLGAGGDLTASLSGMDATLLALDRLLAPVLAASRALRRAAAG